MKNKDNFICQRCNRNKILFFCHSCPKQFNRLCSDCDTYIHSIISYKSMHLRDKIDTNEISMYNQRREFKNEKMKELEEKSLYQIDIINKLNTQIKNFKNEIYQLIEEIKNLNREKQNYLNELNYLKSEIEKYKKENYTMKENIKGNNNEISKSKNELNSTNKKLKKKESELEEIKYYYNNKISDLIREKNYLLNEMDKWNNNLIEHKDLNNQIREENNLLQAKVVKLEKENDENLMIISHLQKENKELIRRLNKTLIKEF